MIRCCASKSRTLASSCSALQFASLTGRNMWRRPRTCFLRSTARESSSSSSCYARSHRHGPHGLLRGAWARTHVMGTRERVRATKQEARARKAKGQKQGEQRREGQSGEAYCKLLRNDLVVVPAETGMHGSQDGTERKQTQRMTIHQSRIMMPTYDNRSKKSDKCDRGHKAANGVRRKLCIGMRHVARTRERNGL